jgi:hypothetical protein
LVWRRLSRKGESGYWVVWAWARVVSSRARRTRIGFMDAGVFIQYIIRKAVIVSRPSVVTPNSSAASLKRGGATAA